MGEEKSPGKDGAGVTIVTQTRIAEGREAAFGTWQRNISDLVSRQPGFTKQTVIPPSPPTQLDWVILQRFADRSAATAWLRSPERKRMLATAGDMLIGNDDVHILQDGPAAEAPVSVVISTRVKPGREDDYRRWERKIAALQNDAPGLEGYRFEEPVPGVQDDWLSILRFDSEAHLQAWLDSPQRKKLVDESAAFTEEFHTRVVRTGFDQWFQMGAGHGSGPPTAWKQNMLVLMVLYPVVFLFSHFIHGPLLDGRLHLPFWLALFVGNAASVLILSHLVPEVSQRLRWWLHPDTNQARATYVGAALVIAVYAASLALFSQLR